MKRETLEGLGKPRKGGGEGGTLKGWGGGGRVGKIEIRREIKEHAMEGSRPRGCYHHFTRTQREREDRGLKSGVDNTVIQYIHDILRDTVGW